MGVHTPASDPLSGTLSYPPKLLVSTGLEHGTGTPGPALDADTTKSRTLNGIHVSGEEIDDLFHLSVLVNTDGPVKD